MSRSNPGQVGALRAYRERLIAGDDWDLTDEGDWEEYAKPGGCMFGEIGETRAYLAELRVRVEALLD